MLSNPVSTLNEYAQKNKKMFPDYNVVYQMGDPHNRRFCISCNFMSFKTEGIEKTKQDAKNKAAEEMVYLLVAKNYFPCPVEMQPSPVAIPVLQPSDVMPDSSLITNPIGFLQEYCIKKGWKLPVYEEIGIIAAKFHTKCKCSHYEVTGVGFRKQLAKSNAALKMCVLINGSHSANDFPTQINNLEKSADITSLPNSPLKTLHSEIDCLGSDSVDSLFIDSPVEQNGDKDEDCKYSIGFLYQLVTIAKVTTPEFEFTDSEEKAGRIYTCLCRVITLEAYGYGRTKIESKGEAADCMMRKILNNAESRDTDNSSDEQRMKIVVYLRELQTKECGGDQEKTSNEEVIKKWLKIRQKFRSAKAKPVEVVNFKERHCFFKNLEGTYLNILRHSSSDELDVLIAEGFVFLKRLGNEQKFIFQRSTVTSDGKEKLCVITMDAKIPLAFHGQDETASGAKQNCIKNCLHSLKILLQ